MLSQQTLEYQYFPGCCMENTDKAYDLSIKAVAGKVGMELREIEDWNCCGATPMISVDKQAAEALVSRNIELASKVSKEVFVACSGCYKTLRKSAANDVRIRNILDVFANAVGPKNISQSVTVPLESIKVVPYYGCYISRPTHDFDDAEDPQTMDTIVKALGARVVDYHLKTFCCGGTLMVVDEQAAFALIGKLLRLAKEKEADCIVTSCPLCHMNLDTSQNKISKMLGALYHIPVLYITQLMGLAFGLSARDLGLEGRFIEKNFTSVRPLLEKMKGRERYASAGKAEDRRLHLSLRGQYCRNGEHTGAGGIRKIFGWRCRGSGL